MPVKGMGVQVPPRTRSYVHDRPWPGLCLHPLSGGVVGERQAQLPVDLGFVGRVGSARCLSTSRGMAFTTRRTGSCSPFPKPPEGTGARLSRGSNWPRSSVTQTLTGGSSGWTAATRGSPCRTRRPRRTRRTRPNCSKSRRSRARTCSLQPRNTRRPSPRTEKDAPPCHRLPEEAKAGSGRGRGPASIGLRLLFTRT